jgi:mRNA interferase MazF
VSLKKWDLAWAGLDPTLGHEQAGHRPVLVFCNDAISPSIGLVTVIPLTTWKKGRRIYPSEVLIPKGRAGLSSPSIAMAHQIRTLSAKRLSASSGRLEDPALRASVDAALALWLDIHGR